MLVGRCLVVSTSTIDCLERIIHEMTCYVLCGMLKSAHLVWWPHR